MGPMADAAMRAVEASYRALDRRVSAATFAFFSRYCGLHVPLPAPALRHVPLLRSPTPALLLVSGYLAFCVAASGAIRRLGLKPREKEHPLLLLYVICHNLFLFCLSAYLTFSIPVEAYRLGYSFWGNAYNPTEGKMAWLIYLFYMSKFVEFGDTFIMVMRNSVRQISFLHLYHHATITLIWWSIAFYAPGGDGYFSAALNSGIHVAMYGYYFLAALIGRNPKLRSKYLFWGRYLTQMQMLQFVSMLAQSVYQLAVGCAYPRCFAWILLVYMCTLLALFANFYISKYFAAPKGARQPAGPEKIKAN